MTKHLHMPHPHLTDFIEHATAGFIAGLFHHHTQPVERAVPAAEDWNDWHWAPERGDWEEWS